VDRRQAGAADDQFRGQVVTKKNDTTDEQPKEQKTKRELNAIARQRLGCTVPVRGGDQGRVVFSGDRSHRT
jgi:hypothetical protein